MNSFTITRTDEIKRLITRLARDPHETPGQIDAALDDIITHIGHVQPAPPAPALIDSFPVENQNDINTYGVCGSTNAGYQAITGKGSKVTSVKLSLRQKGAVIGNVVVNLYASTGAFPNAIPTGAPLTTSAPLDASTISTAAAGSLYEFAFNGANQVVLQNGVNYCIALEKDDGGTFDPTSVNSVPVGVYFTQSGESTLHYGNAGFKQNGNWGLDDWGDMIFYLYGV